VAGVFFHPPLLYSEFLKRNEDTLLIHVVGEEHQPRRITLFFIEHLQGRTADNQCCIFIHMAT
jgi:hypothetical protein